MVKKYNTQLDYLSNNITFFNKTDDTINEQDFNQITSLVQNISGLNANYTNDFNDLNKAYNKDWQEKFDELNTNNINLEKGFQKFLNITFNSDFYGDKYNFTKSYSNLTENINNTLKLATPHKIHDLNDIFKNNQAISTSFNQLKTTFENDQKYFLDQLLQESQQKLAVYNAFKVEIQADNTTFDQVTIGKYNQSLNDWQKYQDENLITVKSYRDNLIVYANKIKELQQAVAQIKTDLFTEFKKRKLANYYLDILNLIYQSQLYQQAFFQQVFKAEQNPFSFLVIKDNQIVSDTLTFKQMNGILTFFNIFLNSNYDFYNSLLHHDLNNVFLFTWLEKNQETIQKSYIYLDTYKYLAKNSNFIKETINSFTSVKASTTDKLLKLFFSSFVNKIKSAELNLLINNIQTTYFKFINQKQDDIVIAFDTNMHNWKFYYNQSAPVFNETTILTTLTQMGTIKEKVLLSKCNDLVYRDCHSDQLLNWFQQFDAKNQSIYQDLKLLEIELKIHHAQDAVDIQIKNNIKNLSSHILTLKAQETIKLFKYQDYFTKLSQKNAGYQTLIPYHLLNISLFNQTYSQPDISYNLIATKYSSVLLDVLMNMDYVKAMLNVLMEINDVEFSEYEHLYDMINTKYDEYVPTTFLALFNQTNYLYNESNKIVASQRTSETFLFDYQNRF